MKRILLLSAVLMLSLSCWGSEEQDVDLSTPEKTLRAYYDLFKKSDFKHQKRTMESSIESLGKERFDRVKPILQGYEILKIREAKDRKEDTFHLPEGDVDILVKEIYKDNKESLISFVLRKLDNRWLINSWDIEDDTESPPDINVIDEQAKRMLERKEKKYFESKLNKTFTLKDAERAFGKPDRVTGSGLTIFVYVLDDGREIWLGFAGDRPILYAKVKEKNNSFTEIDLK
jgi:hypothetical protein